MLVEEAAEVAVKITGLLAEYDQADSWSARCNLQSLKTGAALIKVKACTFGRLAPEPYKLQLRLPTVRLA